MNEKVVEFKHSLNNKGASEKVVKLANDNRSMLWWYI